MRVSIVITNFNYGHFLPQAIESALAQTHPDLEVVVVDDGSTDDSAAVLERYTDRVTCVFKENGGQASAFNEGFRLASGELVIFLDADDLLLPGTAAAVATAFARDPAVAKIHYRLEIVDAEGRSTGEQMPPASVRLPVGDLRRLALRSPDDVVNLATSGNAFPRRVLERLLPVPEETWPDMYLVNLALLLGPVARLDSIGGLYRVHGANLFARDELDLERVRATLLTSSVNQRYLSELAVSLGLAESGEQVRFSSVTNLAQRLMSLKLEPRAHPFDADRPLALAARGVRAAWRRSDLTARRKLLYTAWFAGMAAAPRRTAERLSRSLFTAWKKGKIRQT